MHTARDKVYNKVTKKRDEEKNEYDDIVLTNFPILTAPPFPSSLAETSAATSEYLVPRPVSARPRLPAPSKAPKPTVQCVTSMLLRTTRGKLGTYNIQSRIGRNRARSDRVDDAPPRSTPSAT